MNTFTGILLLIIGVVSLNKSLDWKTDASYAPPFFMAGFFAILVGVAMFIYGLLPLLSLIQ